MARRSKKSATTTSSSSTFLSTSRLSIWTLVILLVVALCSINIDKNGQWTLAPHVVLLKPTTWFHARWNNSTIRPEHSPKRSLQHGGPLAAQNAANIISNTHASGLAVSHDKGTSDFDHQSIGTNALVSGNKAHSPLLGQRAPLANNFDKLAEKGKVLLCYLKSPTSAGAKATSKWTTKDQLHSYGWKLTRTTVDYNHIRSSFGDGPFSTMDFSGGTQMLWEHSHSPTVDGVVYYATNAQYNNVFWPDQGIIFANDNHNPESRIAAGLASKNPWKDSKGKPLPIVPVKQWSDFGYLSWQFLTSTQERQNLKYVFRRNVINLMTVNMISEICKKQHNDPCTDGTFKGAEIKRVPGWPGIKVYPGDEAFDALVGSPNSYGVAWMIIQHNPHMGHKTIKNIQILDEDPKFFSYAPTMIMEIGDIDEQ